MLAKDKQSGLSIMYNSGLRGVHASETATRPHETVVFFLSRNGGWNKSGGAKEAQNHSFGKKGKKNVNLMGFADGHVEFLKLTPEQKRD